MMGILNRTPDSFYEGSRLISEDEIIERAGRMLEDGAGILDIGGYSTRPGASEVAEETELERIIPAIKGVKKNYPRAIISVDTFRPQVAKLAVKAGARIINDISGGDEEGMFETVASLGVPYILMHRKGNPSEMQKDPHYENVLNEVMEYFIKRLEVLKELNVQDVIIDPGFGFGKNLEHNFSLLDSLQDFNLFRLPILAGFSRKKMIQQVTGTNERGALNGTTVLNTIALMKGAKILRVHDVKEAVECIKLATKLHGTLPVL